MHLSTGDCAHGTSRWLECHSAHGQARGEATCRGPLPRHPHCRPGPELRPGRWCRRPLT
jgi:hypothetical protein